MRADNKIDYSLLEKAKPVNILAVEDDQVAMSFLDGQIRGMGHDVVTAVNGQKALDILENHPDSIDVVLMDKIMPVMDGLSAVKRMKANNLLRHIPVIMITGDESVEEMREGLDAGVFYYLVKPVEDEMLRPVLAAAIREAQQSKTLSNELGKHKASFNLIDTAKFNFRTLDEARSLAAFIANCYPEPKRVLAGLGELLINAIEHGNLGIGYNKKTELIDRNIWESEVKRLQKLPENEHKFATATIAHKVDGTYVVVEDQGDGFAWKNYMHIDPSRAGHNHGRGIAQANTISFDKLIYNQKGNQAVAFVGLGKQLEW